MPLKLSISRHILHGFKKLDKIKVQLINKLASLRKQVAELEFGRKQAEEALQRNKELFQAFMKNASNTIMALDDDRSVVDGNPSIKRTLGYEPEGRSVPLKLFILRCISCALKKLDKTKVQFINELVSLRKQVAELEFGRKQAEEALQRSKELFQALMKNASDTVMVLNNDRSVVYVSPSIKRTLGYEPEEWIGKNIFDLSHPEERHKVIDIFTDEIKNPGYTSFTELRTKHKDGSWRTIESTGTNLLTYPSVSGIVVNLRDITELKQAEEAERGSEEKFEAIFNNALDGICLAEVETHQLYTGNRVFCDILGYNLEEIRKMKVEDIHPEQHMPYVLEQFNKQLGGEITLARDIPMQRKDGSVFYTDVNSSLITLDKKTYLMGIFRDITERRQADEALQQSKQYFQALIENSFDTILILNGDGSIRYATPSITRLLGYGPEERLGSSVLDFIHPDSLEKVNSAFNEGDQVPGYVTFLELQVLHKDGSWRIVECVGTNLLDNPSVAGVVVNLRDITDRKEAEEALQHSKEYFQALIENAFDTVTVLNADLTINYVSPSIKRISGYEPEELIGKNVTDFIQPDNLLGIISIVNEGIRTPGYVAFAELQLMDKDGSYHTAECMGTNLLDHPHISGIVVNLHDITERKQSEEKLRQLLGDINDGYIVYQGQEIVLANQGFAKIFGYKVEQVLGQPYTKFISFNALQKEMERYAGNIDGKKDIERYEVKGIKQDGTQIMVDLSIKEIEFEGKPAFSIIFRDITEQKQANKKLQQLYEREINLRETLEEERKRKSEFMRVLVHELKTPLTPMMASSQLLADELQEGTLRKLAHSINKGSLNLSNRVDDLLDLVKGEIGTLHLNFESVDMLPLLHRIADDVAPMASSNGQTIILDLPQYLPLIWADENRLQQVMLNLFNNASKFTPSGGEITLRARRKDTILIVEVQNTGDGLSEEERQRLFEPYYRVESDRQHLNGLGLGLSLCKTLVELHQGQIWVESRLGEGSTFGFSLPLDNS